MFHSDANRVLELFYEICKIPHGSGNTDGISRFCAAFAENLGLETIRDGANNIIVKKPGTKGYEDHAPVILQGHIDMVCEKDPDCDLDFEKDPLRLKRTGKYLCAEGTTLGADNGIAVAYALALLESKKIPHPPLEIVLTSDEEIGMLGAAALDVSPLQGKTMLNLDSEAEGVFTAGCAGGVRLHLTVPVEKEAAAGKGYRLILGGGSGGHSGAEIHRGICNAVKAMGKILASAGTFRLASLSGGGKDNAIPSLCVAEVILEDEGALSSMEATFNEIREAHKATDPGLTYTAEAITLEASVLTAASTEKAVALLNRLPDGVQKMSPHIAGLVQTSLNLGIVALDEALHVTALVRSSVNAEKAALRGELEAIAEEFGGSSDAAGDYPAWEYREESRLRAIMTDEYDKQYGKYPVVEVIHAGLECGLFGGKIPDLDAVAIGPEMHDIHTPRERLSIPSAKRTWRFIKNILKAL